MQNEENYKTIIKKLTQTKNIYEYDTSQQIQKYEIYVIPPFICPFVQTADMEIVVTIVTMLARHITAIPSPAKLNISLLKIDYDINNLPLSMK